MNIASISKTANKKEEGLEVFKKFRKASFYISDFTTKEEFNFYWKVSKYGNLGAIINTL